jgi:hypothetical protein
LYGIHQTDNRNRRHKYFEKSETISSYIPNIISDSTIK